MALARLKQFQKSREAAGFPKPHRAERGRGAVDISTAASIQTRRAATSGESRIIFLPERSSICQYPPKISAINVNKQSRAGLLLAHPVSYV